MFSDPKVVLTMSWGSLGRPLGALGGLLGASWAPLGCSSGSLRGVSEAKEPSWVLFGCSCCPSSRLISFDLLSSRVFSSPGASCGRFWVSKMTLRPHKSSLRFRRCSHLSMTARAPSQATCNHSPCPLPRFDSHSLLHMLCIPSSSAASAKRT